MENQDKIKDLFADKLGNYQAPVDPQLWNAISSQIASTTVVTTTVSLATKIIIGISAAGIIGVGTYFFLDKEEVPKSEDTVSVVSEKSDSEKSSREKEVEKVNIPSERITSKDDLPEIKTFINERQSVNPTKEEMSEVASIPIDNKKGVLKERVDNSSAPSASKATESHKEGKEPLVNSEKPTVIINAPQTESKKSSVEITNAPNVYSTKHNGAFLIEYTGKFLDYSFVVLDLNNTIVFETNNPDFKWYGEMKNGEIIPTGRYFYLISGRDEEGNKVSKSQQLIINPN